MHRAVHLYKLCASTVLGNFIILIYMTTMSGRQCHHSKKAADLGFKFRSVWFQSS